jgi:uncharacterized protein (TIGR03000 family)
MGGMGGIRGGGFGGVMARSNPATAHALALRGLDQRGLNDRQRFFDRGALLDRSLLFCGFGSGLGYGYGGYGSGLGYGYGGYGSGLGYGGYGGYGYGYPNDGSYLSSGYSFDPYLSSAYSQPYVSPYGDSMMGSNSRTPDLTTNTTPSASAKPSGTPARLTVRVPADAEVFINDQPTTTTGVARTYLSQPLLPNLTYTYTVQARWQEDGHFVTQTRDVTLSAGAQITTSFGVPSDKGR